MSTQRIGTRDRSFLTTDDRQFGFANSQPAGMAASTLWTASASDQQTDSAWAALLQGELEEAVDTVLLRASLAGTLTMTGGNHQLFG